MINIKSLNLNLSIDKIVSNCLFIFITFLLLFGRTFMGLNLYFLRLGEVLIGFLAIVFFYYVTKERINKKFDSNYLKNINALFLIILLHFIFLNFFYKYIFFDLYPFKTSSYIWVLGSIYLGINFNFFNISKLKYLILSFTMLLNYYFSIFGISSYYQEKLMNYTDKFDYLKASDLVIYFIFITFVLFNSSFFNKQYAVYLFLFGIFYLPLIMNKSRGASIAFIVLLIFLTGKVYKEKFSKLFYVFILISAGLLFILSTFIVSKSAVDLDEIDERIIIISTGRYQKPIQNVPSVEYPTIYFENGRVFSGDGNLNWRFQIWQDVIEDLYDQNKIIIGYGYNSKIPAMDLFYRSGNDGSNENVHNFFVNVIARGGLIHLTLFFGIFLNLYRYFKKKGNLNTFLFLLLPVMITSFFDASMENSHFPVIFYFLIGNLINKSKFKKINR